MNSVIVKEVTHRSAETGRVPCQWEGVSVIQHNQRVVDFRDLAQGTCFKMIAGRWLMRKVSESGAIRCRDDAMDRPRYTTFSFEGWERCYVIQPEEDQCALSLQCSLR